MSRFGFVLAVLLVTAIPASATEYISLQALSNSSTGSLEWGNSVPLNMVNAYISQFQMNYYANGLSNPSSLLYTYCVDLTHDEQFKTPYAVSAVSLTGFFGNTVGNEIGWLFQNTPASTNLSGSANVVKDVALQLAFWTLSENQDPNNTRPQSDFNFQLTAGKPSTGYTGVSNFGVKNLNLDPNASGNPIMLTNMFLSEAYNAVQGGYSVGNSVQLLANVPNSNDPQQNVLLLVGGPNLATPEPPALLLWAAIGAALGCFALLKGLKRRSASLALAARP